jgi:hypothetical protein
MGGFVQVGLWEVIRGSSRMTGKPETDLQKLINEPAGIEETATWQRWIKILDSSLLGGHQSTFIAVAFTGSAVVGASAGDSRLCLFDREGELHILTENTQRLGSGSCWDFYDSIFAQIQGDSSNDV